MRNFDSILCSPNEDFGRSDKHFRVCFRSTFQRCVAQIEYSTLEKFVFDALWNVCPTFQNLRLGSINFRSTFQGREYSIWATIHWKVLRKSAFRLLFLLPKSSFGRDNLLFILPKSSFGRDNLLFLPPKSSFGRDKMPKSLLLLLSILSIPNEDLEGLTTDEMRMFESLFKGVSTRFGLLTIEKCFENLHFICCQTFQNLRLGSIVANKKSHFRPSVHVANQKWRNFAPTT